MSNRFSPKDAKIIRDNQEKTAEELLALGLSQKAYSRLKESSDENAAVNDPIQPVSVEQVDIARSFNVNMPHDGQVKLHNLSTGNVVAMGHKSAVLLSTKYPQSFKILP